MSWLYFSERVKQNIIKHGLSLVPWKQKKKPSRLYITCKNRRAWHQDSDASKKNIHYFFKLQIKQALGRPKREWKQSSKATDANSALNAQSHGHSFLLPLPTCGHLTFPPERPYLMVMKVKTKCAGKLAHPSVRTVALGTTARLVTGRNLKSKRDKGIT